MSVLELIFLIRKSALCGQLGRSYLVYGEVDVVAEDDRGASALVVAFAPVDNEGKVRGMPQTCDSVVFILESLGLHIVRFLFWC